MKELILSTTWTGTDYIFGLLIVCMILFGLRLLYKTFRKGVGVEPMPLADKRQRKKEDDEELRRQKGGIDQVSDDDASGVTMDAEISSKKEKAEMAEQPTVEVDKLSEN